MRWVFVALMFAVAAHAQDPTAQTIRPPGKAATAAQAVQGVLGGVPVAVDATFGGTVTTSCRATAAAPTYVEGTDNSLSCDLAGATRTTGGGGGSSSDVVIHDNGTPTRHLTIDASGQIGVNNFPASQAVTGTFWQATQPVSGPLTDAQLRASAVPVSAASLPLPAGAAQEHVAAASFHSTRLTDGTAFYKATTPADTQPTSVAFLPLPAGASTEATLALIKAKTDNLDVLLSTRTKPADVQVTSVSSTVVPTGLGTLSTGQLAVTAVAQQLPANAAKVVCIRVLDGSTRNVSYGPSGVTVGTGSEIVPTETACRPADNTNRIFVVAGGTGSTVAWEVWN